MSTETEAVLRVARAISGAPFPSAKSIAKARAAIWAMKDPPPEINAAICKDRPPSVHALMQLGYERGLDAALWGGASLGGERPSPPPLLHSLDRGPRSRGKREGAGMNDLRTALGDPFLAGHSGCEEGPHVKLIYETVAEAMRAHDALKAFLAVRPKPPPETQLEGLIRLRAAVIAAGGPQSRIDWIDKGIAFERDNTIPNPTRPSASGRDEGERA